MHTNLTTLLAEIEAQITWSTLQDDDDLILIMA